MPTSTGRDAPSSAADYLPSRGGLPALRRAAADCRGCALFEGATQTVFGSGTRTARIVLVGEQPGDQEDRSGEPFVGPAGRLLRKALAEAGIEEDDAYFTNAVKHFKFAQSAPGKRRIHKPPSLHEMTACRPWLAAELKVIDPHLVVALGATAGKALLGGSFRVNEQRGRLLPVPSWEELGHSAPADASVTSDGAHCLVATVHPSAVLRATDRQGAYGGLVSDLRMAAGALE
ncbi:UdgX family uracil-DNA binding protein [Streptomyces sp. NPDC051320]|uniref:UdgX family uracil-DNA binding protein n=1 Tax=Streptomyces sp. NPDC051320 TaxID=3154644 RepID=UPI0034145EAA